MEKHPDFQSIVIPRDKAVFRLDGNGRWRNRHGHFRHKRIIDHFHRAIERDQGGYYVIQQRGDVLEKVYFPYDDTALFVFEVSFEPSVCLTLNTGCQLPLDPAMLFIQNDILYLEDNGDRIRFTDRSMMALAGHIEMDGERYLFRNDGQCWPIELR